MPHGRLPKPGAKWYLPEETFRMVQHFCRSYKEIKKNVKELNDEIDRIGLMSGQNLDGMPHGTDITDPTSSQAIKRQELEHKRDAELNKITIIERAVQRSDPGGLGPWLFMAVTDKNMTCICLQTKYGMPCEKNAFSLLRREIYWRVAQEL